MIDLLLKRVKSIIIRRMATRPLTFEEWTVRQKEEADERHAPVLREYLKGKSQAQVAAEFGVTRARVQQILRRAAERGLLDGYPLRRR